MHRSQKAIMIGRVNSMDKKNPVFGWATEKNTITFQALREQLALYLQDPYSRIK